MAEPKELTPEELENLTEEEAEKLMAQDQEAADPDGGEQDGSGDSDDATTSDDKDAGGDESEEDAEQEAAKPEGEEKKGDPLKDTQRAFHEKARMLKEAELENQRLKAELEAIKSKSGEAKAYEDGLTKDELDDLQYEDPEKWRQVVNAREKADAERDASVQKHAQVGEEITAKRQLLNTLDFAAEALGIDLSNVADPFNPESIPEPLRKYLTSEEFQRLEKEVVENFRPGADGIFTREQLAKAHRLVNWDQFAAEQRQKGAEASLMAIQRAAQAGSKFDSAPKGEGSTARKSVDKLSQEDIMSMGLGELESYYKELGIDG